MASNKQTVVDFKHFNPDTDCGFSKPKINKVGGKNVRITYNKTNDVLHLSTPLMLTWGVNEYMDEASGKVSYDITLQFPNPEYSNADTDRFLEVIKSYEKKLRDTVKTNCREWLNKPTISDEGMDLIWNPILRYPKDKQTLMPDYSRPPSLKIKVPFWSGKWDMELYNASGSLLFPNDNGMSPIDLITKGSKIAVLLQSGGIYFASGKCGSTFRLFQGALQPKATLRGQCHIPLATIQAEDSAESEPVVERQAVSTVVEDSDDEDEQQENEEVNEPEPEPVVAPVVEKPKKVVKKVVKRKA